MNDNQSNYRPFQLYPIDAPVIAITPRILAIMQKDNISKVELAKRLKISSKQLEYILSKENYNYSWVFLSKILGALGYRIEGLRLQRIDKK